MERRAQLILTRARELLARDDPHGKWLTPPDTPDSSALERQAAYLSAAEQQLLDEGLIESVDQS